MMPLRSTLAVLLLLGGSAGLAGAQPPGVDADAKTADAKTKARDAAESWLALTDDDAFEESWARAAVLLQQRIERKAWVKRAERLRDTVQTLSSRTLALTRYRDSLRCVSTERTGAFSDCTPTDGPFVLLKYHSSFATGRYEELLLTVRRDTTWKVAGYQVTPFRTATDRPAIPSPDSLR